MFLFNANTAPNTPRTQIVVLSNMTTPCVSKLSFNKDNITNNKNKELRTKNSMQYLGRQYIITIV